MIAVLQIAMVILLLALTMLIFFPIQKQLSSQVLTLKNDLIELLEANIGSKVEFSSIHPSIFSYIEIRNLRIFTADGQTRARIDRLVFRYDIRELIRGNPLSAPRFVEVRGGNLFLDSGDNQSQGTTQESGPNINDALVELSRELTINFRNFSLDYSAEKISFRTLLSRGQVIYDGRSLQVDLQNVSSLRLDREEGQSAEIVATSTVQGQLILPETFSGIDDLSKGAMQFYISTGEIESNWFSANSMNFYLAYERDILTLRTLEGKQPYEIEVEYSFQEELANIGFNAAEWMPSSVVRLNNIDPNYLRVMNSIVSGGITLEISPSLEIKRSQGWLEARGWLPFVEQATSVRIQYTYDGKYISLDEFAAKTASNDSVRIQGTISPASLSANMSGSVELRAIEGLPRLRSSFRTDISAGTGSIYLNSPVIEGLDIDDSRVDLSYEPGLLSAVLTTGLAADQGEIRFSLDSKGALLRGAINSIEGGLEISGITLPSAVHAAWVLSGFRGEEPSLPADLSTATINASSYGTLLFDTPEAEVSVSLQDILVSSADGEILRFNGSYKNGTLSIPYLGINYLDQSIQSEMRFDLGNPNRLFFDLRNKINGTPYNFAASYIPGRREFNAKGSYGTAVSFRIISGILRGQILMDQVPVGFLGDQAAAVVRANFDIPIEEPLSSKILIKEFSLERMAVVPLPDNHRSSLFLSATGSLNQGVVINRLEYSDFISTVEGQGMVTLSESGSVLVTANLLGATEQYTLSTSIGKTSLAGQATVRGLPMRRVGLDEIVGLINARAEISGSISDPLIRASIESENARLSGDRITIGTELEYSGKTLQLSGGVLETSSIAFRELNVDFSTVENNLGVAGYIYIADTSGEKQLTQYLSADFFLPVLSDVTGSDVTGSEISPPELSDYWAGANGSLQLESLDENAVSVETWDFRLEERGNNLHMIGGPSYAPDSLYGFLEPNGGFEATAAQPLPFTFSAEGFFEGSNMDVNLRDLRMNFDSLFESMNQDIFYFRGGQGSGSLRLSGSLVDPEFFGTIKVERFNIGIDYIPGDITSSDSFVIFESKTAYIHRVRAVSEAGEALVDGYLDFDRWIPSLLHLDIATLEGAIPVVHDFGGMAIDSLASGSLLLEYDFKSSGFKLTGNIVGEGELEATEYFKNAAREYASPLLIDLNIVTGRKVEFFWPGRNFPILRATALNGETVSFRLSNPPFEMKIEGDVAMRSGELFFFDQNFYGREGQIRLNENERSFDPIISVRAEARGSDSSGPVRLYIDIDEDHLSELQPRLSSDPAKTEAEIIALLGGRILDSNYAEQVQVSDALLSGTEILGQVSIFKGIEDEMRNRFDFDVFSIRTGIFQNILEDVIIDGNQNSSVNSAVTLGKYLENTTLVIGRYLGDAVYSEMILRLQETSPLDHLKNDLIGLKLDLEFGLEWETPIFNLRWSLTPKNPQTLFVTDQTFTFTKDLFQN